MNLKLAAEIILWISVGAILYTYGGYPLLLAIVSRFRSRAVHRAAFEPSVSIIITAYNEERDLAAKLENTLALDYPRELSEVIVASDCSTDATDAIAASFADADVKLVRQSRRLGKTSAQNLAVEHAHGEIILFSDATSLYQPDVLRVLLPNFADETVGCVGGRLIYVDPSSSRVGRGASSYWSYETFLKRHESHICSLIGVSGCLYAVRRPAYVPLDAEACSDFIIATRMVEQDLRAVYEPNAICTEETNSQAGKELKMRVRVIAQTLSDLWRHRGMMNPRRSGFYAVELFSHKVMRYFVPVFLIALFVASGVLAPSSIFYLAIFAAQLAGYSTAALAALLERAGVQNRLLALPQYFVLSNLASLIAFYQFIRGERYAHWEPQREDGSPTVASREVHRERRAA